jgi:uncharacterized protein YecT (DUF1311 family)
MRIILTLICLVLFQTINAQTQSEMNEEAYNQYTMVDEKLNEVYQNIRKEYKNDTLFLDNLKKTQRIWITYRDAELEMKYPKSDKSFNYGSVYPLCKFLFLKNITEERIKTLQVWLNGIDEGEVCLGSVKMK